MQPNDLLKPGDIFGSYRIDEAFYEQDGPIQCYVATDTQTSKQVKFQCVDSRPSENGPSRVEQFHATAARLRTLRDYNLPAFYDGGVTDRIYWAATEHTTNYRTLGSILGDEDERFSVPTCFMVATQLAQALQSAHRAGVMHLRLDPGRILVHREMPGLDKVLDVGMAQLFSLTPAFIRSEPLYAAPEQLREKGKAIDERADIYALGMVLYAIFAWVPPFADKDGELPGTDKLLLQAMTQTPLPLGKRLKPCPDFLDVFVQSLIAKPRSNRPPSLDAVCDRISDIAARYVIWGEARDAIGQQDQATKQSLIAALRGPAPEGTDLQAALARFMEDAMLPRAPKRQKPQSGKRPSTVLRAAMEGYRLEEIEGTAAHGTPEPEWLSALPEERDPADPEEAAESPPVLDPSAVPKALPRSDPTLIASWAHVVAALEASQRAALPVAPTRSAPLLKDPMYDEAEAQPVDEPHPDTLRAPVPSLQLEVAGPARKEALLDPVTLPSNKLSRRTSPRAPRARPKHAVLPVAFCFAASVAVLVLFPGPAKQLIPARSAALGAACAPELRAAHALDQGSAPGSAPSIPIAAPITPARRALSRPTPATSASASVSAAVAEPARAPTATPTAVPAEAAAPEEVDGDPCEIYLCPTRKDQTQEANVPRK